MICKTALTAIDHNVNCDRLQGKTASGALKFDLVTHRDGAKYFVRPVKEEKDMSWLDSIASVALQALEFKKIPLAELPLGETMKTRKKSATKPDKSTAISLHQTRMQ